MAAVAWTVFLPEVAIDVPGCPQPVAVNAIKNAVRDFLRRTRLQVVELPAADIVADTGLYELTAPAGHELVGVESVAVAAAFITPLTKQQALARYGATWKTETGTVAHYVNEVPNELRLVRVPSADDVGGLVIEVSVVPDVAGTGPEAWVASKYLETIAAGAKYRLQMMAGVDWSNPQAAELARRVFETGVASGASDKSAGTGKDTTRRTTTYYR